MSLHARPTESLPHGLPVRPSMSFNHPDPLRFLSHPRSSPYLHPHPTLRCPSLPFPSLPFAPRFSALSGPFPGSASREDVLADEMMEGREKIVWSYGRLSVCHCHML